MANVAVGLAVLVGHGVRGVGVVGAGAVLVGEVARSGDAGRADEVGGWGDVGVGVGEVLEPDGDVVPVHEGQVDEVLGASRTAGQVELGQRGGRAAREQRAVEVPLTAPRLAVKQPVARGRAVCSGPDAAVPVRGDLHGAIRPGFQLETSSPWSTSACRVDSRPEGVWAVVVYVQGDFAVP